MGTNIEKIKEQGNQAAPLLTELHDNELIISCSSIQVTRMEDSITKVEILNLRGRQKVISLLEKFKKGEIEAKDINPKFIVKGYRESVFILPTHVGLYLNPYMYFEFSIIVPEMRINGSAHFVIEFTYSKSSGDYVLSAKAFEINNPSTKLDVTTEFTD